MGRRKVDAAVDLIAEIQGATGLSSQKISRAMDALRAEGKPLTAENIFAHAGGNPSLLGPSREYVPPPEAPQPGMERIQRTPLEERLYTDPKFKTAIEEFNPEFAARMQDATPEEIMDVYGGGPQPPRQMELPMGESPTGMVPYGVRGPGVPVGPLRSPGLSGDPSRAHNALRDSWPMPYDSEAEDVMAALDEFAPAQRRYLQALENDGWLGFDYPSQAASAALHPRGSAGFDMSPEVLAARQMLVDGARRPPQSLDAMIARLGPQGGGRPLGLPDRRLVPAGPRDLSVPRQADGSFGFEMAPPGGSPPGGGMIPGGQPGGRPGGQRPSWRNVVPGVVAGAVGGKYLADALNSMKEADMPEAGGEPELDAGPEVMPDEPDALGADDPMATADLAAESRPLPDVAVEEAVDPSLQARQLIDDLNARRRAAGGEVPDAPQVMAEVNRLMEMGNQTRRATYVAAPQDDAGKYYQQAQGMIDQVNQMYRQGMTPNSPEVRQMMAEVRRLQQMGDSLRNRRAG
jgi:hypothetical protein